MFGRAPRGEGAGAARGIGGEACDPLAEAFAELGQQTQFVRLLQRPERLGIGRFADMVTRSVASVMAQVEGFVADRRRGLRRHAVGIGRVMGRRSVRMGVGIGRFAVRSPAGMADSAASRQRMGCQPFGHHRQAAGGFHGLKAVFSKYRNPRGIITAVFQGAEPFQQDTNGVSCAGVTYNTTHLLFSCLCKK